jgi:hypothetical protein
VPRVARAALGLAACAAMALAGLAACATPQAFQSRSASAPVDARSWRRARATLEDLRARWAPAPGTLPIRASVAGGPGSWTIDGRGAMALMPPRALRLVVAGGSGTTVLDLWVRGERFRLASPPAGVLVRGATTADVRQLRTIPVELLSWWILRPFSGRLLAAGRNAEEPTFVLREARSSARLTLEPGGGVRIERHGRGRDEQLLIRGPGCSEAHYRDQARGIIVRVACDAAAARVLGPPSPRAFEDPDLAEPTTQPSR